MHTKVPPYVRDRVPEAEVGRSSVCARSLATRLTRWSCAMSISTEAISRVTSTSGRLSDGVHQEHRRYWNRDWVAGEHAGESFKTPDAIATS